MKIVGVKRRRLWIGCVINVRMNLIFGESLNNGIIHGFLFEYNVSEPLSKV